MVGHNTYEIWGGLKLPNGIFLGSLIQVSPLMSFCHLVFVSAQLNTHAGLSWGYRGGQVNCFITVTVLQYYQTQGWHEYQSLDMPTGEIGLFHKLRKPRNQM
jgi:hypothetical protein